MKPTTTSIFALLAPLATASFVCQEREVAVGLDENQHGVIIANDCGRLETTDNTDLCLGWPDENKVWCNEAMNHVDEVTIKKQWGYDVYSSCYRRLSGDNCDNGIDAKWCCAGFYELRFGDRDPNSEKPIPRVDRLPSGADTGAMGDDTEAGVLESMDPITSGQSGSDGNRSA